MTYWRVRGTFDDLAVNTLPGVIKGQRIETVVEAPDREQAEVEALMQFGCEWLDDDDREEAKVQSVYDPCVGAGSMLLVASNYSLRLFGQDIVPDLVLCCKLNGYLWTPWMVCMPGRMRELLSGLGNGRGLGEG